MPSRDTLAINLKLRLIKRTCNNQKDPERIFQDMEVTSQV
jgi:hypothetical protein